MRLSDIHQLLLNANLSESSRLVGGEKESAKIEAKRYFRRFATLGLNEKNTAIAYFGDISSFGGAQTDDVTFVRLVHAELPHPPYVLIRGAGIHQEVSARFGPWADLAGGSVLVVGVLQNDRRGIPFIVPVDIDHIHFLNKQQVDPIAK
ncbi:hypothetical protein [Sinomonas cyclohexanicum]|uniref:hypothetical protein n=1 Tax=Sinomonas cyclohexanicum TaxID=322009 RepID=UPI001E39838E|nr:hypothetical protein [Corynebacterium cyclohexanicum]